MSVAFPKHPFLLTVSETADVLGTDVEEGLLTISAVELQRKYPRNELNIGGTVAWYTILSKQVANAMILVRKSLPTTAVSWHGQVAEKVLGLIIRHDPELRLQGLD